MDPTIKMYLSITPNHQQVILTTNANIASTSKEIKQFISEHEDCFFSIREAELFSKCQMEEMGKGKGKLFVLMHESGSIAAIEEGEPGAELPRASIGGVFRSAMVYKNKTKLDQLNTLTQIHQKGQSIYHQIDQINVAINQINEIGINSCVSIKLLMDQMHELGKALRTIPSTLQEKGKGISGKDKDSDIKSLFEQFEKCKRQFQQEYDLVMRELKILETDPLEIRDVKLRYQLLVENDFTTFNMESDDISGVIKDLTRVINDLKRRLRKVDFSDTSSVRIYDTDDKKFRKGHFIPRDEIVSVVVPTTIEDRTDQPRKSTVYKRDPNTPTVRDLISKQRQDEGLQPLDFSKKLSDMHALAQLDEIDLDDFEIAARRKITEVIHKLGTNIFHRLKATPHPELAKYAYDCIKRSVDAQKKYFAAKLVQGLANLSEEPVKNFSELIDKIIKEVHRENIIEEEIAREKFGDMLRQHPEIERIPENREAIEAYKNGSWTDLEQKMISFCEIDMIEMGLIVSTFVLFCCEPEVQQILSKFVSFKGLKTDAISSRHEMLFKSYGFKLIISQLVKAHEHETQILAQAADPSSTALPAEAQAIIAEQSLKIRSIMYQIKCLNHELQNVSREIESSEIETSKLKGKKKH